MAIAVVLLEGTTNHQTVATNHTPSLTAKSFYIGSGSSQILIHT